MRESRQIEDKMRDTYSQLRRSAYELGSSPNLADDGAGGLRIKASRSTSMPVTALAADNSSGREVTLLENGLIVEGADVRERMVWSIRLRDERQQLSLTARAIRCSCWCHD